MSVHWYTDNNNVNTIKQASASNEFCQLLSTHAEIVRQVYQPAISSILHTSLSLAYVNQLPFPSLYRGPTNLIKQISRRFPRDSRRDFKKNPGHVCLASASCVSYRIHYNLMEHIVMSSSQRSSLCYSTDYNISCITIQHVAVAKIKQGDLFLK